MSNACVHRTSGHVDNCKVPCAAPGAWGGVCDGCVSACDRVRDVSACVCLDNHMWPELDAEFKPVPPPRGWRKRARHAKFTPLDVGSLDLPGLDNAPIAVERERAAVLMQGVQGWSSRPTVGPRRACCR